MAFWVGHGRAWSKAARRAWPRRLEQTGDGGKSPPVDWGWAERGKGRRVGGGAIALMPGEAIAWVICLGRSHPGVAGRFGENRCCGNARDQLIALDHRLGWAIQRVGHLVPVDQRAVGARVEG